MYRVTKTYGHERGLSCVYRQPRATSHCRWLHGYSLAFEFEFECIQLDERGWVIDFGALKPLEQQLRTNFDHTLVLSTFDPQIATLTKLVDSDLANVIILQGVGCEYFAKYGYDMATDLLKDLKIHGRVWVRGCKVSEHGANSATFYKD